MKFLKYLFIIIVPNILLAQQTWTLQDCVNRAIEMNISIKQSKLFSPIFIKENNGILLC